jgi:hypothetical protein
MLASSFKSFAVVPSCNCGKETRIMMWGYGEGTILVCNDCALQLVRKVTEDLCELLTASGRHG